MSTILFVNIFMDDKSFIRSYVENNGVFEKIGQDILYSDETNIRSFSASNFDGDRLITRQIFDNMRSSQVYELVANNWLPLGQKLDISQTRTAGISNEGNRLVISDFDNIRFLDFDGINWNIQTEFNMIDDVDRLGDELTMNGDGTIASVSGFDSEFDIGSIIFYAFPNPEKNKFIVFNTIGNNNINNTNLVDEGDSLDILIGSYVNGIGCQGKIYKVNKNSDILKMFSCE